MLSNQDSQIAAFLERIPVSHDVAAADEPQVIFRGAMELDRLQEDQMVAHALRRLEELTGELGRDEAQLDGTQVTEARPDLDAHNLKFMPRRQLWDLIYHQRFDWRRLNWGGIYAEGQNLHIPLARRGVQQMISRGQNYFFQTSPWCSVDAVGMSDPETATATNEWVQYRFHKAKLKGTLEKAVELAFIRGECVVKSQHVETADYYQTYATVAIGPDGVPLIAQDGDYIFEDDVWVPAQAPVDETTGEPLVVEGAMPNVLKRDMATPMPPQLVFEEQKIRRRTVQFSGPQASIRPFRDFLAPLNSASLQVADVIIDLYDVTAIEIVEQYKKRLQERGQWDEGEFPRVMELLRQGSTGSREGSTSADANRPELGEQAGTNAAPITRADPLVQIAEVHMWYDADADGTRENVYLLIDVQTKRPILYDYTSNVFKGGKRPYSVVRINPVDNRWTGISAIDMLWPLQKFADLTVNRWDMSLSRAGAVTFFNAELTREGESNPNLELNGNKVYHKRDPNIPANKIVERVPLYEFKGAALENILELIIQLVTNLTGTANVNDAAMAGLDTAKLATGVRNMDRSGQEQFAPLLAHLTEGIDEITEVCLALAVQYMDEVESFNVLGPDGAVRVKQVAAQDLRALEWTVNLEMTRYKAEQEETQSTFATQVALEYYGLPPNLQLILYPLYRNRVRMYGVQNVDSIIRIPTEQDFANFQAQQMAAAGAPGGEKKPAGKQPAPVKPPMPEQQPPA